MSRNVIRASAAVVVLAGLAACGTTDPAGTQSVSLSFSTAAATAGPPANLAITMTNGANTLIITRAQMVLRELELKQSSSASCATGTSADDCEEIQLGPMLIELPTTAALASPISAQVPAGTYREIEFDIRRPGTDPADVAFVTANPNFNNVSIRVEGTYNGTAFVFTSQVDQEVQIDFNPPVVIAEGANNVTIAVNIRSWFTGTGGALISPATANPGQPNASIVAEKIKTSLRAFEDDDKNGQ